MVTYLSAKILDVNLLFDSRNVTGSNDKKKSPWLLVKVKFELIGRNPKIIYSYILEGKHVEQLFTNILGRQMNVEFDNGSHNELKGKNCILCVHVKGYLVSVLNADEIELKQ